MRKWGTTEDRTCANNNKELSFTFFAVYLFSGGFLTVMALPAPLKSIQHHLRTAQEHEKRDPVVAYYCKFGAKLPCWLTLALAAVASLHRLHGTGSSVA